MTGNRPRKTQRISLLFLTAMLLFSVIPTVQAAAPTASFTYEPLEPTTSDMIYFNSTSTDDWNATMNHTWDMGDGTLLYGAEVSHRYADDGTYTVTLNVTDNETFYDTHSEVVTVTNLGPSADFTWTPASPSTADVITFSDTSTDIDGTITNWTWDFGDGNSSDLQHPNHTYADNGTYTVILTVMDDDGATASANTSVDVANRAPVASFDVAPNVTLSGENVTFTDASTDADGTITNWTWDFGDGNTSYLQNTTHAYAAGGEYTVALTVTDDDGASNTTTRTVNVTNRAPTVSFTYSPEMVFTTANATFQANATDPDGTIVSYVWDFGDGTENQTGSTTSHDFNGTGIFTVTLTVTDDQGATASANQSISVRPPTGGGGQGPFQRVATALQDPEDPTRWILTKSIYSGTKEVVVDIPEGASPVDSLTIHVEGRGILSVAVERLDVPRALAGDEGYALDHPVEIHVETGSGLTHEGGVIRYAIAGDKPDLERMVALHGSEETYQPLEATYEGLDAAGRHLFAVATDDFSPFALAVDQEGPLVTMVSDAPSDGRPLAFEISDNRGIQAVLLRIDGIGFALQNNGSLYWSEEASGLAPGAHEVQVEAIDLSGLATVKTWSLEVPAAVTPAEQGTSDRPTAEAPSEQSAETPTLSAFAVAFAVIALAWIVIRRI